MLVKHLEALRMREEELVKEGAGVYEKAKAAALRAGRAREIREAQEARQRERPTGKRRA